MDNSPDQEFPFEDLLLDCLASGLTYREVAYALNAHDYATPDKGVWWNAPSVGMFCRKHKQRYGLDQAADLDETIRQWQSTPMPEFPVIKRPSLEILLAGTPFLDTSPDGQLDLAISMRRTK